MKPKKVLEFLYFIAPPGSQVKLSRPSCRDCDGRTVIIGQAWECETCGLSYDGEI